MVGRMAHDFKKFPLDGKELKIHMKELYETVNREITPRGNHDISGRKVSNGWKGGKNEYYLYLEFKF